VKASGRGYITKAWTPGTLAMLNAGHLRRRLRSYLSYYHVSRTRLALEKDAPEPRAVEPPGHGQVVALPQVGGLHHRYVRRAA
jgi:putative transposase